MKDFMFLSLYLTVPLVVAILWYLTESSIEKCDKTIEETEKFRSGK